MGNCPQCGSLNPDDLRYCGSCGFNISDATGQLVQSSLLEGRYVIVKTLGQGGMGAVYLAYDQRLKNMPVAVKEMSTKAVGEGNLEAAIELFKKEAEILSKLRHPALPRITDFFSQENARWYLVMDYIEGETLEQVVARRGSVPEDDVLDWARQLCEVLDYLHSQEPPVIFRDLKPSNIILTPDGKVKLIDFGIARHFKPNLGTDTVAYGSLGFSPPEQFGESQTDARSDIYALGATLHYLLTGVNPGKKPFTFDSPGGHLTGAYGLEVAIMKALELKPENRPTSAREMLRLLNIFYCPRCGASTRPDYKFCIKCSFPLKAQPEPVLTDSRENNSINGDSTVILEKVLPQQKPSEPQNSRPVSGPVRPSRFGRLSPIAAVLLSLAVIAAVLGSGYILVSRLHQVNASSPEQTVKTAPQEPEKKKPKQNSAVEKKQSDQQKIKQLLNDWVVTFREKNYSEHMKFYAGTLENYYNSYNQSIDSVYQDKQRSMNKYQVIDMSIKNLRVELTGDSLAVVTFDKKWDARGIETFAGEEQQRIKLKKINGDWKIYSEEEVKVYWVVKNGKRIM